MFYQSENQSRVTGVFIGVVTNNKDPDKLGRVKVRFPKISKDNETDWIRIATLFTGAEFGSFFLPEVKDEVLVAFENGDINMPFVIGSLWNGVNKPVEDNADGKNNFSVIKTRSGHTLKFDNTDGSEKIEIIDKTTKNLITIDSSTNTISIVSDADITMTAKNGKIALDASDVEIKGSSSIKIESSGGLDAKASGTANFEGNTTNIKGSTTNVKGSTVNLN
ncbi:phage tail protein [Candidatus Uabimicrobium amorphum]|uniref:Phage tail protein n=2 Tax=Uabimicrobium amorphum TaxID=2596890 RepID=A0A5S9IUG3_UABAM|nr:phage tail protein [Candidatus Uabimicrobium amorphum]